LFEVGPAFVALEVSIAEDAVVVVGEGGGGEVWCDVVVSAVVCACVHGCAAGGTQTPAVVVAIEDVLWSSVVDALGSSPCGGGSCSALARRLIPSRVTLHTSLFIAFSLFVFPSSFPLTIITIMDASTLMALTSQDKMLHTVCDGHLNPIDSPNEGVFVI
jgi:hypothetical protein